MSSAPRVLVLGSVLGQGLGGVRRHNQELLPRAARRLAEQGGSLAVLEGASPCAFPLPEEVERIPSRVAPRPALRRALAEGYALRRLLEERAAQGRPFQVVHTAHQPVPRGFETPLTVLIHDLRSLHKSHSPFSRRLFARDLIGRSARRAGQLMTVSQAMAEEIEHQLGIERDSVLVIPNGGDHFHPLPRCAADGAPLLCVGHLEPRKNQQLILQALALDPALPKVHFVGASKAEEEQRLRTLARQLGVETRVTFLGAIDDEALLKEYASTRCVVLPSLLEGFGIAALEAQLARAPLAVSCIPAHVEVTSPGTPAFEQEGADCVRAIREAMQLETSQLDRWAETAGRFRWDDSAGLLVQGWRTAASLPGDRVNA